MVVQRRENINSRKQENNKWTVLMENFFAVILVFYPLRHIFVGGDLWDTGYNYANFQYMGMEHMDPMWLFSTHLANMVGNLLTMFPGGDSLAGMNFYTGLFVSVLALLGYFFCTRKLGIPAWITFLGEMFAVSLCWCPTALLYNYLTYVLFLGSCILLYLGLTKESSYCLLGAGVLLGTNVLTRFSNLPEMAMIVAVWAYDIILWLESRKAQEKIQKEGKVKDFWPRLMRHTLWCLLGYVAALVVWFAYIQIRYGLDEYIAGILRLFAMTDNATDYKPTSMIMGLVGTYVENLYWVIRFGVIVVGSVLAVSIGRVAGKLSSKGRLVWTVAALMITTVFYACKLFMEQAETVDYLFGQPMVFNFLFELDGLFLVLLLLTVAFGWKEKVAKALCIVASALVIGWLYYRQFCSWAFYSYDSMLRPAILFLMLTMLIAVIRIFHRDSAKEEKLISGMLILIILLTSLGSNNGVYPSINNLFLAAPYTLWQSWRFVKGSAVWKWNHIWKWNVKELAIDLFPAKVILIAFVVLCFFQCGMFGVNFVFAEGTGVQNATVCVENNAILQNVKMAPDRAEWLTEISAYVTEENLQGQEVILYGDIPSLSYYLQMPSAFNPWSDLDSYSYETMESELRHLAGEISLKGAEKPVIIVDSVYALYEEGDMSGIAAGDISENQKQEMDADNKFRLLLNYMKEQEYKQVFKNEKFAIYR